MQAIILSLYLLIVIMYVLACIFIIYHIAKYSLNQEIKTFTLLLFTIISVGLFIVNFALFFSTNWNNILANIF